MTQLPGSIPAEFRRSTPYPALSSLSPLAAPFTAGGRPLASDPVHNPASLGPTAPTMLQSSQHQRSIPGDAFAFASGGGDGIGAGGAPYYQSYEPWKPSWAPDVGGDGSSSWIDPSQSYPVSTMDKVSAASMTLKHYEQSQIPPSGPHTNPLLNTYHNVPEASPWKQAHEPSFYSTGSLLSNGSRSSGMGPTLKEPSVDPFSNASGSSVHMDPFLNGFRSSVVAPMLKELLDSFSLDAGTSKGYHGLPYDKYMDQLESCSTHSPTDPPPYGPGSGLGVVPTGPLVKGTSGFSSVNYGNPCRISLEYFDYMPQEQKDPVAHSNSNRTKVTIAAPVTKSAAIKGDNQVVGPHELEVKCRQGNPKPGNPGTGFDLNSSVPEALDEHSVVLDSPCWKGMPSSSQYTFSKRHTENSCNFPLENEIPSGTLLPSETVQDKKLDSVTIGLVNSSEEKAKYEKTNQKFKPENVQENVSSDNVMKDKKGKGLASAILSDSPRADAMLLIKSMHDLSQVLLTSCGDDFELKEHELELLQIAIENLKSFTGRRNKTDNDEPASSIKIAEEISAGTDNRTSSTEANNNQINVGPQLANTNYKKSVLEALDKIPAEDSEVQAELYKNLWIEAEASLCTMKYELQLVRTKLKMKSQKQAKEANSSCLCCDPKPSSSMQTVGATALPKQTLGDLDYGMSEERDTEVPVADPAVMARLRIIKSRTDNTESQDQSNSEKSVEENITVQNKDFSSLASSGDKVPHDEVDSGVMARMRILKRRGDVGLKSVEENITVQNEDFSSLASSVDEVPRDEVDSDVMARLRILKRRGDIGWNAESVLPNYYSLGFATEPRDLHPQAGSSEWEHVLRDELSPSGNNPLNG